MSQFIAKIDVDKYTISFHREGSVWAKAKGVRGVRMLQYMLYDPYDGVPYGTIDYSLEEHRVLQARIDQTDYSKSDMPSGVVKLFMKHVICVLENK